jgi:hypothetical protein
VIRSVVADGKQLAPAGTVEFPSTTTNLQIAYSGLSLSVPERVQFRYRLTGLDHEWQYVGTRRTAYYERLPPGTYDFQVRGSNDARSLVTPTGSWRPQPLSHRARAGFSEAVIHTGRKSILVGGGQMAQVIRYPSTFRMRSANQICFCTLLQT